jgi:hypothetical protein
METIAKPLKKMAVLIAAEKFTPAEQSLREFYGKESAKVIIKVVGELINDLNKVIENPAALEKVMTDQWYYNPSVLNESWGTNETKVLNNFLAEKFHVESLSAHRKKLERALSQISNPDLDKALSEERKQ